MGTTSGGGLEVTTYLYGGRAEASAVMPSPWLRPRRHLVAMAEIVQVTEMVAMAAETSTGVVEAVIFGPAHQHGPSPAVRRAGG